MINQNEKNSNYIAFTVLRWILISIPAVVGNYSFCYIFRGLTIVLTEAHPGSIKWVILRNWLKF